MRNRNQSNRQFRRLLLGGIGFAYALHMAGTPIIVAEGVSKKFGAHQVLTRVSLPVMERDVVCVVGPSGSGKTTLLRCIALLETPSEGRIVMQGQAISTPEQEKPVKAADGYGSSAPTPQAARVARAMIGLRDTGSSAVT